MPKSGILESCLFTHAKGKEAQKKCGCQGKVASAYF